MRNKNLWIILAAVIIIALMGLLAVKVQPTPAQINGGSLATATDVTGEPQAYLLVSIGGTTYEPIGLHTEEEFTFTQEDSGATNVVHVTPTSVYMASSTCDNQDCVEQGVVSLETMHDRALGNMIICLPHRLTLELYTVEDMNALIASQSKEDAP